MKSIYRLYTKRERVALAEPSSVYGTHLKSSRDAVRVLTALLEHEPCEVVLVLLLNAKHSIIGYAEVGRGGVTSSCAAPADVFRPAIIAGAASVLLAHNHPSGDPNPSDDDLVLTRKIVEAGKLLGIPMVDHVIIGDGSHFSFVDHGLMPA
jgi:DNA repair protein RadC